MANATHDALTLIFNGFTALGTVGACMLSLYLARAARKPFLKVNCNFGSIIGQGAPLFEDENKFLSIIVTNYGLNKEHVDAVGYQMGIIKFKSGIIITNGKSNFGERGIPATIDPGEKAHALIELTTFYESHMGLFVELLDETPLPSKLRKSKAALQLVTFFTYCYCTSSRDGFARSRLGKEVRAAIVDRYLEIQENRSNQQTAELSKQ